MMIQACIALAIILGAACTALYVGVSGMTPVAAAFKAIVLLCGGQAIGLAVLRAMR